jgi:methylenetetrahydrofolate dehydrogenase (NADP+)/methenyltetrahydrofolate cyclohydrolase
MATLLKAQPLVDSRIPIMRQDCADLVARGIHPKLVVVLVGDNPASLSYITNKKRLCEKVGALFELRHLSDSTSAAEFRRTLDGINADPTVHGCIIQLPVYGESKTLPLEAMVAPGKDVDGFHPANTAQFYLGRLDKSALLPCTPKGVMSLLHFYGIPLTGKHAVVIGRSQIVGKPLSLLLNLAGATVTMCHSQTRNLAEHTRRADLVITAVGKENLLRAEHFDPNRHTVVIDVGMNKNAAGKLVGDVDFAGVEPLVSAITPVPGGVGPMTVLSLIENLLTAAKHFKERP